MLGLSGFGQVKGERDAKLQIHYTVGSTKLICNDVQLVTKMLKFNRLFDFNTLTKDKIFFPFGGNLPFSLFIPVQRHRGVIVFSPFLLEYCLMPD